MSKRPPAPPVLELEAGADEVNRIADQLVGECIRAVVHLLASRRRLVKVGGLREGGRLQLVALLALAERTLELYPGEEDELREHARRVAEVIAR